MLNILSHPNEHSGARRRCPDDVREFPTSVANAWRVLQVVRTARQKHDLYARDGGRA
jgi:hypothetical protein